MTPSERNTLRRLITATDDLLEAYIQANVAIDHALGVARREGCQSDVPHLWSKAARAREELMTLKTLMTFEEEVVARNSIATLRRQLSASQFTSFTRTQLLTMIDDLVDNARTDDLVIQGDPS